MSTSRSDSSPVHPHDLELEDDAGHSMWLTCAHMYAYSRNPAGSSLSCSFKLCTDSVTRHLCEAADLLAKVFALS